MSTDASMVVAVPPNWVSRLRGAPESGIGFSMVSVVLNDGRQFERVPYMMGLLDLAGLAGFWKPPFVGADISDIIVTHDRSGPPRLVRGGRDA
jgi:hypothetical protein